MADTNGWIEYKQRVLYQLEELATIAKETNVKVDQMKSDIHDELNTFKNEIRIEMSGIREDVIVLQTKIGIYSALAGFIGGVIVAIIVALL